ncbi:uncharacterized protein LOC6038081 [Culex quinquefasciatus]|uniref:uncharacterized protein LOC6038081 n=1 Tax=Culex quinquefasciatus TaxID=7176 RepID=UPI0018E3E196|nr:uncharacterized protein LOC6038081 [Culex quinquefasciatus]
MFSSETGVKMKAAAKFGLSFLVLLSVVLVYLSSASEQSLSESALSQLNMTAQYTNRDSQQPAAVRERCTAHQSGMFTPNRAKSQRARTGRRTLSARLRGNCERVDVPLSETPQPTPNCPRLNGYFGSQTGACDKFYYCVDGKFNMITCPAGLVFNPKTGICTWPDEAGKSGCTSEDVFSFSCPKVNESIAVTHPRYADPDDCQFFYVCINGDIPRRNGCKLGQVFDDSGKHCEWARKVPECADWYKDRLTDKQLEELENPPTTKAPAPKGPTKVSRRRPSKRPKQPVEDEE